MIHARATSYVHLDSSASGRMVVFVKRLSASLLVELEAEQVAFLSHDEKQPSFSAEGNAGTAQQQVQTRCRAVGEARSCEEPRLSPGAYRALHKAASGSFPARCADTSLADGLAKIWGKFSPAPFSQELCCEFTGKAQC